MVGNIDLRAAPSRVLKHTGVAAVKTQEETHVFSTPLFQTVEKHVGRCTITKRTISCFGPPMSDKCASYLRCSRQGGGERQASPGVCTPLLMPFSPNHSVSALDAGILWDPPDNAAPHDPRAPFCISPTPTVNRLCVCV